MIFEDCFYTASEAPHCVVMARNRWELSLTAIPKCGVGGGQRCLQSSGLYNFVPKCHAITDRIMRPLGKSVMDEHLIRKRRRMPSIP